MADLYTEQHANVAVITFNREAKRNAFDDQFLLALQDELDAVLSDSAIQVILLKANGPDFSAGADLNWMQSMVNFSEEDNLADALVLARLMYTLYSSPKPTLAAVQGAAFGGGAGLVAACDTAIASHNARFCFSEVKLGLIPAVISPYVVQAIGARAAKHLFMSAEPFTAERAKMLGLVHHCVADEELLAYTLSYAEKLAKLPPEAVAQSKQLVNTVAGKAINNELLLETARWIAKKRVSAEGQKGLQDFLYQQKK